MKKGCFLAVISFVLLCVGAAVAIYWQHQSIFNPQHHGKRVYAWAHQAMHDPDPTTRRQATEELVEAFRTMPHGEPRIQLTMKFCGVEKLPKEMLPFVLETLHAEEMPPGSYQSIVLGRIEPETGIPVIAEILRNGKDPHIRDCALSAFEWMDSHREDVKASLRMAVDNENDDEVRKILERVLQRFERLEDELRRRK